MGGRWASLVMILSNARLIDGAHRVWERAAIQIEGARISAVGEALDPAMARANDVDVVDLAGKTVMPGLINSHTHLSLDGSSNPVAARRGRSITENGLLKVAIEDGILLGPRMLVSGLALCMTGGTAHFIGREVDGPAEARKGAREQLKAGADLIKIMATGGVMTPGVEPGSAQLTYEEMCAAVAEAGKAGKAAAAHAQGTTGIKNALRAGVDSIEHGVYLDAEAIDMMLACGATLVPTLAPPFYMIQAGAAAGVPGFMVEKAKRAMDAHLDSFRRAREAGVRIAAGNDGGTPFNTSDNLVGELECMVRAGMAPAEALASAHLVAAQLLRLDDQIGSVEPGKLADLVVLHGDPLHDISALRQVHLVLKEGVSLGNPLG
jgi:imidazolonepropionase-like amidohydrolase